MCNKKSAIDKASPVHSVYNMLEQTGFRPDLYVRGSGTIVLFHVCVMMNNKKKTSVLCHAAWLP